MGIGAGYRMFSVIIATRDSERALVATLAALVAGATAGIVREVIVADGGSRDETEQVADIAGCQFIASVEPLGARLKAAAATGRGDWLMFLQPGAVPRHGWIEDIMAFTDRAPTPAAVFADDRRGTVAGLRAALPPAATPPTGPGAAQVFLPRTRRVSRRRGRSGTRPLAAYRAQAARDAAQHDRPR